MKTLKFIASIVLMMLVYFAGRYIIDHWKKKPAEQEEIVTKREIIKDEIIHYSDLEKLHADSAQFYRQKANATFKDYISVMADTSGWNSVRAAYRANLEAKIRTSLAGQRDSLRVP